MTKKTVIKVDTSCAKCKRKVLQAVSSLQGVDKIEIDSEKGTMTVTGSVDPVDVIDRTRKAGKRADIVTIGAPPSSKPEEKKPEQQKKNASMTEQHEEKKHYSKLAPQPPVAVYVHHVPSWSWPAPAYEQRVVYHEEEPSACSVM